MENIQRVPLKVYIQDVFRAKRSEESKYVYELFGLKFKNIMIHGVVTAIYNTTSNSTNLELSDPTGSVQIYFDWKKTKQNLPKGCLKHLYSGFANASRFGDDNLDIMSTLLDAIAEKSKTKYNFQEGCFISVVGDIFVDDRDTRMVSAFECSITNVNRDLLWLEELRYLYDKYYIEGK